MGSVGTTTSIKNFQYITVSLQVIKLLYDMELVEEDAIIMWADEKQMGSDDDQKYVKKAATFVSWLREAETEGSTSGDSA